MKAEIVGLQGEKSRESSEDCRLMAGGMSAVSSLSPGEVGEGTLESKLADARRALAAAEEKYGLRAVTTEEPEEWPLPDGLRPFLPQGIARGMTIACQGSPVAQLLVASVASSHGAWCVFLGCADVGWAMAQSCGLALERVVVIPDVPAHAAFQVASVAMEGFDVVVLGPNMVLDAKQRRAIEARASTRKCLLLERAGHGGRGFAAFFEGAEGIDDGGGQLSAAVYRIEGRGKHALVRFNGLGWHLERPRTALAELKEVS